MDEQIARARTVDAVALAELFGVYRKRLRRLVDLRLDRRLRGRIDPSDVLQQVFIDLAEKLPSYAEREDRPFYLWLRLVVGERLSLLEREHLNPAERDVGQEVTIRTRGIPQAASQSIAAALLGNGTSVSAKAMHAEMQLELQEAINGLDEVDREVIVLRNFKELSNAETAIVLAISPNEASNRYLRALKRLKSAFKTFPSRQNRGQAST